MITREMNRLLNMIANQTKTMEFLRGQLACAERREDHANVLRREVEAEVTQLVEEAKQMRAALQRVNEIVRNPSFISWFNVQPEPTNYGVSALTDIIAIVKSYDDPPF